MSAPTEERLRRAVPRFRSPGRRPHRHSGRPLRSHGLPTFHSGAIAVAVLFSKEVEDDARLSVFGRMNAQNAQVVRILEIAPHVMAQLHHRFFDGLLFRGVGA